MALKIDSGLNQAFIAASHIQIQQIATEYYSHVMSG